MAHDYEVRSSRRVHDGHVISLRVDTVAMPGDRERDREVVEHPGAVGIVALNDRGEVLLLRQYRHPVGQHLWELPAGLLDEEGEAARATAARELHEEAGLQAKTWHTLVDTFTSPGMSDEATRVYLARDISETSDDHDRVDEEADMTLEWVPLADAVRRVLNGDIQNALCVIGLLAAAQAQRDGYSALRPPDAPWPARASAGG